MKLLERARPEILALQPYSSARMEAGAAAIMLNANESPWPSVGAASALNRYPDPQPAALRTALARLYSVAPDNVLVGRGSDEAIDLLVRAFCREGCDAVVTVPPTFGMYAVAARIQGAAVIEAPRGDGFVLDVQAILAAVTEATKLAFVCTPNNPTGGIVPLAVLSQLAGELRDRALLVVDAAQGVQAQTLADQVQVVGARRPDLAVVAVVGRMRGSTAKYSRSAARSIATNSTEQIRVMPCTTG